jgi:hypothetical protein
MVNDAYALQMQKREIRNQEYSVVTEQQLVTSVVSIAR